MERPRELEIIIDELLIKSGVHKSRVRNPLYGEERQLAKDTALIYGNDLEQENEGLKVQMRSQVDAINELQSQLKETKSNHVTTLQLLTDVLSGKVEIKRHTVKNRIKKYIDAHTKKN